MRHRAVFLAVVTVSALLPFMVPQFALTILIEALIFSLFAMSLDLMVGYCKLYSFGHAAAYGLGAYACALLLTRLDLPLPLGIVLAFAIPVVIAPPAPPAPPPSPPRPLPLPTS